jgi:hypothetical protein
MVQLILKVLLHVEGMGEKLFRFNVKTKSLDKIRQSNGNEIETK